MLGSLFFKKVQVTKIYMSNVRWHVFFRHRHIYHIMIIYNNQTRRMDCVSMCVSKLLKECAMPSRWTIAQLHFASDVIISWLLCYCLHPTLPPRNGHCPHCMCADCRVAHENISSIWTAGENEGESMCAYELKEMLHICFYASFCQPKFVNNMSCNFVCHSNAHKGQVVTFDCHTILNLTLHQIRSGRG